MFTAKDLAPCNEKGEPHGYWEVYYHHNGKLRNRGTYINGKKHGCWEEYHFNGVLLTKAEYVNGIRHGWWESYYTHGKLYYKGNLINGEQAGLWFERGKEVFYAK